MVKKCRVRTISRKDCQDNINPYYIVGFFEGEGTFHIAFGRRKDLTQNWSIMPELHISQHKDCISILNSVKSYFGCGYIKENHPKSKHDQTNVYVVKNRKDLIEKIIPFFTKFQFLSEKKKDDFKKFSQVVMWLDQGIHFQPKGLRKIVDLAYSMNRSGKYRKLKKHQILSR
ncbi:MAG: Homing endonuclease LAGLIDADG/HNH [Candidatus Berkelbacteria bacterium Licking1014_7]|uniref:Homing endonuclease LAGLIDADG/HNH n=1 Tax=Candidatus Berkelbacteria bacterium Licking1014_7 TaxID=2017147 RepID=A0A554LJT7_9BACT|nr:MAG: Homing endonuclease LAGLIDADG/HNH [Candidatus Berkelbacteria bacterium Licking1014_7]